MKVSRKQKKKKKKKLKEKKYIKNIFYNKLFSKKKKLFHVYLNIFKNV